MNEVNTLSIIALILSVISIIVSFIQVYYSFRPYVVCSFLPEDGWLYLVIENTGNIAAKNIKIEASPELNDITKTFKESSGRANFKIEQSILSPTFLPPKYKIRYILTSGVDFFKEYDKISKEYEFKVSYNPHIIKMLSFISYEDIYKIDLDTIYTRYKPRENSTNSILERIAKAIETKNK